MLQGSDDTVILPGELSPLMTSSQFDNLIRGPISSEQDKTHMDDVLQPKPSVATRQGDVLQPTSSVPTRQEGVPGPSRTDIVHDAAVFAGLEFEWYSSQEDELCSKAQPSDPPTNAPLETDQSPPSSPIPPTQNYMLGDMNSAIKHLQTVYELRQWGDEWNVADHPPLLRALVALGDSEAFLALQLQKMADFQSISDFAGINGVYDNEIVRGKLLRIAENYDIDCPNDVSDIRQLALHIQNGLLPGIRFHACPDENWAITSFDSVVQGPLQTGSFRPEMVATGGEQHTDTIRVAQTASSHEPGQVIYTRYPIEELTVQATANSLQTGSFRPEMVAEVQHSVFSLPHDQVIDTDRGSPTDSIRPEMVGMGDTSKIDHQTDPIGVSQPALPQADDQVMGVSDNIELEPFQPLHDSGSQLPDVEASISLFKCSLCESKFANSLGLERHTKNKHPNTPICFVCLKTFATRSNLTRHKTQDQCKGRPNAAGYQCLKCNKILNSTSRLRKHTSACNKVVPGIVHCRVPNCGLPFANRREMGHHKVEVHGSKK